MTSSLSVLLLILSTLVVLVGFALIFSAYVAVERLSKEAIAPSSGRLPRLLATRPNVVKMCVFLLPIAGVLVCWIGYVSAVSSLSAPAHEGLLYAGLVVNGLWGLSNVRQLHSVKTASSVASEARQLADQNSGT